MRPKRLGFLAVLLALVQAPQTAIAEIDLGSWRTHSAMAEQVLFAVPLPT